MKIKLDAANCILNSVEINSGMDMGERLEKNQ